MAKAITVDELTIADFKRAPVWEFDLSREAEDDLLMIPVAELPVDDLSGRIVGCEVLLANGQRVWAMIDNVDCQSVESTREFVGLAVQLGSERFHLARYFDVDFEQSGPPALAKFLGLPMKDVFPITYDLTRVARGKREALVGKIEAVPLVRLTKKERMALIIGS